MKKILNEQLYISSSNPLKTRMFDYKAFTYPWHFHSEFEIMYIEKGYGQCIVGDSFIDYAAGDVILFGSGLPHCMQSSPEFQTDEKLRVCGCIIQFEQAFMQHAFKHYIQFIPINRLLEDAVRGIKFDIRCSLEIQHLLKQLPATEGVEQILLFLTLLHRLSLFTGKVFGASSNYNPVPAQFKDKKIEKIISYINRSYTGTLTLHEVSSFAAMNPSSFCRYFKDNTGKTLIQYITEMRIAYACKLLSSDRYNISEVSAVCGFDSIIHFNRCFKKCMGITPSDYRMRILKV